MDQQLWLILEKRSWPASASLPCGCLQIKHHINRIVPVYLSNLCLALLDLAAWTSASYVWVYRGLVLVWYRWHCTVSCSCLLFTIPSLFAHCVGSWVLLGLLFLIRVTPIIYMYIYINHMKTPHITVSWCTVHPISFFQRAAISEFICHLDVMLVMEDACDCTSSEIPCHKRSGNIVQATIWTFSINTFLSSLKAT